MKNPVLRFLEWQYLHAHLGWIYESAPQQMRGATFRNGFVLWRINRGSVQLQFARRSYKITSGQWVLLPPGRDERLFSNDARILSMHFSVHWLTGLPLFEFHTPQTFTPLETADWEKTLRPLLKLAQSRFPRETSRLHLQSVDLDTYGRLLGLLLRWLQQLWRVLEERGATRRLPQFEDDRGTLIKRQLDRHPLQKPFRLHELARQLRLSPNQVNRIFFAQFSTTPKRYFESRRLRQAQSELTITNRPIKEISWRLGFKYNSLFSAWFLSRTQKTPRQFRTHTAAPNKS